MALSGFSGLQVGSLAKEQACLKNRAVVDFETRLGSHAQSTEYAVYRWIYFYHGSRITRVGVQSN